MKSVTKIKVTEWKCLPNCQNQWIYISIVYADTVDKHVDMISDEFFTSTSRSTGTTSMKETQICDY